MEEVEQICDRILIMDKGKQLAIGTNTELKQMIKNKETVTLEALDLTEENLKELGEIKHVYRTEYDDKLLTLYFDGGKNNMVHVLNYLDSKEIAFARVHSELPTLNDVFLEITGTQLRD